MGTIEQRLPAARFIMAASWHDPWPGQWHHAMIEHELLGSGPSHAHIRLTGASVTVVANRLVELMHMFSTEVQK